jgi:tetratricopeptide (TPR) repeat protein
MMAPDARPHLDRLVNARVLREVAAGEFTFHHALMHEAVYSTLLRRERRLGHLAVAETLVSLFSGTPQFDAFLGELAYHYERAEAWPQAMIHAQSAGEKAQTMYAPREAIEHFSRALTAVRHMGRAPEPTLLRARGQCLETVGNFDGAEADYAAALAAARASGDGAAEWQALLDLGLLWSARDYARAGEYLKQALALARANADPAVLARSLNRLGNWMLNQGQAQVALQHHQEALSLFAGLQDETGLADTFDLLGMASFLAGDPAASNEYSERAVALFRALDNRVGLVSSLVTLCMRGANLFTDTVVPTAPGAAGLSEGKAAVALARSIQHRTGEAFALIFTGVAHAAGGNYEAAMSTVRAGLALAEDMQHTQWQVLGHCALGGLYVEQSNHTQALVHLLRARELAHATRSIYWIDTTSGWLARAYLLSGTAQARAAAREVLALVLREDEPPRALGRRVVWAALAESALADGDSALALRRIDALLETSVNADVRGGAAIPRLGRLRAEALWQLGQTAAARGLLAAARAEALRFGMTAELARMDAALQQMAAPN